MIGLTCHSLWGDQGSGVHFGGTVYRTLLCWDIRVRVRKAERAMWHQTRWKGPQDSWSPTLSITDAM